MNSSFKPKGYDSVSIYMMADGPGAVIDFAKATFDAKSLRRYEGPNSSCQSLIRSS